MKSKILFLIQERIRENFSTVETMRLWSEQMLANNAVNMRRFIKHARKKTREKLDYSQ